MDRKFKSSLHNLKYRKMLCHYQQRLFRNSNGCCICRTKSSSSRFTDSSKYEPYFEKCFRLMEKRTGDICNTCVRLVKKWKKLPNGTDRHWNHVVDARAGPRVKSTHKSKHSPSLASEDLASTPTQTIEDEFSLATCFDSLYKSYLISRQRSDSHASDDNENGDSEMEPSELEINAYVVLTHWRMSKLRTMKSEECFVCTEQ